MDSNVVEYIILLTLITFLLIIYLVRRNIYISAPFILTLSFSIIYVSSIFIIFKSDSYFGTSYYIRDFLFQVKKYIELVLYSFVVVFSSTEKNKNDNKIIGFLNFILLGIFLVDSLNIITLVLNTYVFKNTLIDNLQSTSMLIHIVSLFILGLSLIYIYSLKTIRKNLNTPAFFVLIISALFFTVAPFFLGTQYNNFISFAITILLYAIYINVLNPGIFINYDYNVFNEKALFNFCTKDKRIKEKTSYILVKVKKVRFLEDFIGQNSISTLLFDILKLEKDYFGFKNVYYLENEVYLLRINSFNKTTFLNHEHLLYKNTLPSNFSLAVYPSYSKLTVNQNHIIRFKEIKNFILISSLAFNEISHFEMIDYNTNILSIYKREQEVLKALKRGIYKKSFMVYYQPIYNISLNKSNGSEALVRFYDEDLGFIGPEEFIPIAEKHGIVNEIDSIVIESVIDFMAKYHDIYNIDYVDVNLSHKEVSSKLYIDNFLSMIERKKVPFSKIHLEITETTSFGDDTIIRENMYRLRKLGFLFSLDDYGSGYATIDYLMKYNFDIIKIDKSILSSLSSNKDMYFILLNIIQLAQELNKKVIMEGVETLSQETMLKKLGVNFLQGFYYSRPLNEKDYIEFLKKEMLDNE